VAVMRKDYDGLKARYFNDTQEVAMTGRSNVFIEIMSVVDDFERAKVRPVGRCVRGGRGTPAHPIRQRQRLTRPVLLFYSLQMAYKPQSEEEAAILADYAGVQDAIIQGMIAQGMEEIKTVGEVFDFKLHDCMFTEQSVEHPEDIITRASRRCCWGGLPSQSAQAIIKPAALPASRVRQSRSRCLLLLPLSRTTTGVQQGLHDRGQGHPPCQGGELHGARPLSKRARSFAREDGVDEEQEE